MEIKGTIIEIFETVDVTASFKKRDFAVEYIENPEYPECIKFELIQDKCSLLDNYTAGQEVTIQFNLKGRKWTSPQGDIKYFNTLQAWRLSGDQQTISVKKPNPFTGAPNINDEADDLPF